MHTEFAEIGTASRMGCNLGADALELAAADILQPLSFGGTRSRFIEIHRNLEALPDLLADLLRHRNAIFNRDSIDRNEWDDVGGAHAGMSPGVLVEIDQFGSLADAANGGFLNGFALTHNRDHTAVVIGVHLAVEQVDARHFHGVNDRINFGFVASFRKIWNTFDERGHNRRG